MEVRARASCRADLAGGTLDIWPLGVLHPGARTINVALELGVEVTLRPRRSGFRVVQGEERHEAATVAELVERRETALVGLILEALEVPPVDVRIASESPRGAGLGASSALSVALIAAGEAVSQSGSRSRDEIAWLARDIEARLMGLPTGCQDHYPALYGGVLEIRYPPGGTRIAPLEVDLQALSESLVLAYSGASHVSAENNWSVVRGRLDGDERLVGLFEGIASVAAGLPAPLEAGDLATVGAQLSAEWALRRELSEVVSIPLLEELLGGALEAGAWGGKACGAGGGGCIAILAPPEKRVAVEARLEALGASVLPGGCAAQGLHVEVRSDA